jgi:hypothetical protein
MNQQPLELTDSDRRLLKRIARSAGQPPWKNALPVWPALLIFIAFGAVMVWLPSRFDALGIQLCQRFTTPTLTYWYPVKAPAFELQKVYGLAGTMTIISTLLCAGAFWGQILRDRHLHRLLSVAYPETNAAVELRPDQPSIQPEQ